MTATIAVATKRCPNCKADKPLAAFGRDAARGDGLTYRCRDCRGATERASAAKRRHAKAKAVDGACHPCRKRRHGPACQGGMLGMACSCRCRMVLGLAGPFEGGDPTAPDGPEREVA